MFHTTEHSCFVLLVYLLSASFCKHRKSKRQELHLVFPYEYAVAKLGTYVSLNSMMK